ncbi:MAG: 4Fe-4S binding protein [Victivallaceae bacterium]
MKRNIIEVDESKCNGCGQCIPNCPEGALQIIDGKARLVSDLFCDGLGACIGECPEGAMKVVEREAEPYDERKAMLNIIPHGRNTVIAHLKHLRAHGESELYTQAVEVLKSKGIQIMSEELGEKGCCGHEQASQPAHQGGGCPGSMARMFDREKAIDSSPVSGTINSELQQWPVQLTLLNPDAPFFNNADLLVSADCVPFAFADFHRKYLKGKVVLTFCPKLDQNVDEYVEKLTYIFKNRSIKSVTVLRMEVPCCGGTEAIIRKALANAGVELNIKVQVITLDGHEQ